jgi:branched-subunit amino acid transport protein
VNPWLVLGAAGFVSWLLRVSFIDLFPARRLPPKIRTALEAGGPAAITALIATELSQTALPEGTLPAALLATAGASIAAWRYRNLALTTGAGVAVYWVGLLLGG